MATPTQIPIPTITTNFTYDYSTFTATTTTTNVNTNAAASTTTTSTTPLPLYTSLPLPLLLLLLLPKRVFLHIFKWRAPWVRTLTRKQKPVKSVVKDGTKNKMDKNIVSAVLMGCLLKIQGPRKKQTAEVKKTT